MTSRQLTITEVSLVSLTVLCTVCYLSNLPYGYHLFLAGIGVLSFFYFYFSVFLFTSSSVVKKKFQLKLEDFSIMAVVSSVVGGAGIGLIIASTGLELTNWTDAKSTLIAGIVLAVVSAPGIYKGFASPSHRKTLILLRVVSAIILGILALLFIA